MKKVTKIEKTRVLIALGTGLIAGLDGIKNLDDSDVSDKQLDIMKNDFVNGCIAFISEHVTDGDIEEAIELIGESAGKTMFRAQKLAEDGEDIAKKGDTTVVAASIDKLREALGEEGFKKFEAFMEEQQ